MMPGPFRKETWFGGNQDLYTLLERFGGSEASKPRDLVYALLSMTTDAIHYIRLEYKNDEILVVKTVSHSLYRVNLDSTTLVSAKPTSLRDFYRRISHFSQLALKIAIQDETDGDELTAFILDRYPKIAIHHGTVISATRNVTKAPRLLRILLKYLEKLPSQ
ncbi:hypothetical protein B0T24DRAFT_98882 [Lasiosphaeria ovina]|uniref:Uncharacterized protein n=1 Tax=Lasiosphaeria ovina TaxID=92902 RepID=A0AAE0JU81_9PEZI|nr:hypothetical protein B0T24DRAFT_98882 [Lasiosphaeria ovina]